MVVEKVSLQQPAWPVGMTTDLVLSRWVLDLYFINSETKYVPF